MTAFNRLNIFSYGINHILLNKVVPLPSHLESEPFLGCAASDKWLFLPQLYYWDISWINTKVLSGWLCCMDKDSN